MGNELAAALRQFADRIERGEAMPDATQCALVLGDDNGNAQATWRIIGCSPGVYGVAQRVDEWYETHLWEPGQPWFSPEYVQWMTALPKRGVTLWVGGTVPWHPRRQSTRSTRCSPSTTRSAGSARRAVLDDGARHGRHQGRGRRAGPRDQSPALDKIAFYGVDMAADTEYEMQRAGIHFMTYKAPRAGHRGRRAAGVGPVHAALSLRRRRVDALLPQDARAPMELEHASSTPRRRPSRRDMPHVPVRRARRPEVLPRHLGRQEDAPGHHAGRRPPPAAEPPVDLSRPLRRDVYIDPT
jgi:hypothetical protein